MSSVTSLTVRKLGLRPGTQHVLIVKDEFLDVTIASTKGNTIYAVQRLNNGRNKQVSFSANDVLGSL